MITSVRSHSLSGPASATPSSFPPVCPAFPSCQGDGGPGRVPPGPHAAQSPSRADAAAGRHASAHSTGSPALTAPALGAPGFPSCLLSPSLPPHASMCFSSFSAQQLGDLETAGVCMGHSEEVS